MEEGKPIRLQQYLTFEIGTECNLGSLHARCPNKHPERYTHVDTSRVLDDDTIVDIATRMYRDHGFCGLVAFHYYNEPCLQQGRMFRLMGRIREAVPEARFVLWTNGTLVPPNVKPFAEFEEIHITDYGIEDSPQMLAGALERFHTNVHVHKWDLDDRIDPPETDPADGPCLRMFTEFIIDNYGNVHLCCYDWKGLGSPGNVFRSDLAFIVNRWQAIRDCVGEGDAMSDWAPDVCQACPKRCDLSEFDPAIAAITRRYLHAESKTVTPDPALVATTDPLRPLIPVPLHPPILWAITDAERQPKIAVVFVAYRSVPAERLHDHFRWNTPYYRKGVHVYVVSDCVVPTLSSTLHPLVFPESDLPIVDGKPRFSLCKTKNFGINEALADGADIIICTDVDIAMTPNAWDQMIAVQPNQIVIPVYRRAKTFEGRHGQKPWIDLGMAGTQSATAEVWRRVKYNERCFGYGGDDGILQQDMRRAGVELLPAPEQRAMPGVPFVYHIDHPGSGETDDNQPGHGRSDCYGRADGFNFDNFENNRRNA